MTSSGIRDNRNQGKVGEYLAESITENSEVSIVSAYFTIYAYEKLQKELDGIEKLRFLFGDPSFIKSIDPNVTTSKVFEIVDNRLEIPIEKRLDQKKLSKECSEWIKNKVEIKSMIEEGLLHGKLYHVKQKSTVTKAIAGSSNFTVRGLGLGKQSNIELNLVIDSDRERKELYNWFNELWESDDVLVKDVKKDVLDFLEQLYSENSPEFIYYKTLYHLFSDYLLEQQNNNLLDEKVGFFDSEIWGKLYNFQKDGVKSAINKILKHNGCIIADSVGLGKTFEALAVIKYFELLNQRVLVLCPKKLSGNWTIYQSHKNNNLNPLSSDRFSYSVMHHTDLSREGGTSRADGIDIANFNWGSFDLVVIDESHNFRGNPKTVKQQDGSRKKNRAQWLLEEIIQAGPSTKVLLLSATPVNNTLKDLRNQIMYITQGQDNAFLESCNIKRISDTLRIAQKDFSNWAHKPESSRTTSALFESLDASFFKLMDEVTIARSRKHVINNYDMSDIGSFPKRKKPISIYPDLDLSKNFPNFDTINERMSKYKLSLFNPTAYLKNESIEKYSDLLASKIHGFHQDTRESFLIGMMKVNFLKRLESSVKSFELSMSRTIKKIDIILEKIDAFNTLRPKEKTMDGFSVDINVDENDLESTEDISSDDWQVGKKLKFDLADLNLQQWYSDLLEDKKNLTHLYEQALAVDSAKDEKLDTLKKLIQEKVTNPLNKRNKKVVVFTAFTDTADYLHKNIAIWAKSQLNLDSALITGSATKTSFGKNDFDNILINFSPKSKNRNQQNIEQTKREIDILIATDCISEGQNLQDCDYLINYDIHWNPVRIIQRFGRIDRIGSTNDVIQLVNFWPTKDLDTYINLKDRVESRMALADLAATTDDNLLLTEQEKLIAQKANYRNNQIKRSQTEVLDLEDMNESISLTDFSLDDYRIDLLQFIENNKKELEDSPLGLYALAPSPSSEFFSREKTLSEKEKGIIKPGVIFCLSEKKDSSNTSSFNPLSPYFLAYIRDDGTVRYNYVHPKQILEIFRQLCRGENKPIEELCSIFDSETNNGENMRKYTKLLDSTCEEITKVLHKKNVKQLLSGRSGVIQSSRDQLNNLQDFDLVTWLVIK